MELTKPEQLRIELPWEEIAGVCRKHGVSELAVFGSVLREDFDPERSDVDFLVRFVGDDAGDWGHKYLDMRKELEAVLGRKADVVSWVGVERSWNAIRRSRILKHARRVYAVG